MGSLIVVDFKRKSRIYINPSTAYARGRNAAFALKLREADARLKFLGNMRDIKFPTLPTSPYRKNTDEDAQWWAGFWQGYSERKDK
jgi:hypothetical protein